MSMRRPSVENLPTVLPPTSALTVLPRSDDRDAELRRARAVGDDLQLGRADLVVAC